MHVEEILTEWLSKVSPKIHSKRHEALGAIIRAGIQGGKLTVTGLGRSIQSAAKEKHISQGQFHLLQFFRVP